MNYCSQCGRPVVLKVPPGDNLPRHVCEACQTIHYQNPKIVAGCIPEWEDQILLCRRAIEPRTGFWTFPAGFMEAGEDTAQAAARETLEEAKASVEIASLYALFSLPQVARSIWCSGERSATWSSAQARKVWRCNCSRGKMCPGSASPSRSFMKRWPDMWKIAAGGSINCTSVLWTVASPLSSSRNFPA